MKNLAVFRHGLIWFGAAVSVAEIEAGLQIGSNGAALVVGHLVGGALLFAAGLVGARTGKNAMETAGEAFGIWGMRLFALLNFVQLVGWTTVMLSQGAVAVSSLSGWIPAACVVALAILVAIWVRMGLDDARYITTVAVLLLALLAVILTVQLAGLPSTVAKEMKDVSLGFWSAFEISVAMPLSWLPLISDYTRHTERPVITTGVSAFVYTVVSCWMYAIGMLLNRAGLTSLTSGIAACGLGVVGLVVVVISTVTTTFLDAYSAGESAKAFTRHINPKMVGIVVCAVGAVLAISGLVDRYVDFLYLIASVFAPMAAVLLMSRYLIRRSYPMGNLIAWLAGTATYQFADASPIGPTLTSLLVAGVTGILMSVAMSVKRAHLV